jgi:uncharacterized lipoprotein YddW (UPF0748 family)
MSKRTLARLSLLALAGLSAVAAGQASAANPPPARIRGVWMHPGQFGPDRTAALEKIRATLDAYEAAGIDTVIMLVKDTAGYVYYPSRIALRPPQWEAWDFFGEFLAEARSRKMTVHAWFCVFPESSVLGAVREHPEWLIRSPRREIVAAANPALPEVRAYERSLMMEVVARYRLDWVHLDYIRFPCEPTEPFFSFDAETLRLFQEYSGVDLAAVKAHDSGNMIWNEWLSWNRDQVTRFVRELRESLRAFGWSVRISAAVFPDEANARVLIGQDWAAWAREGLVDMLCPMLYTNHAAFFEKFTRRAVEVGRGLCRVCPGIGIGTSHNQNTPDGMAEQMRIGRDLGADGVVFFSGGSLKEPFLEKLKAIR